MPATDATPPPEPPVEERRIDAFDLADLRRPAPAPNFQVVRKACNPAASSPNEIVVCAPNQEENRLHPLTGSYATEDGLPRAEWSLGGIPFDVHTESVAMPDGSISKRVMVGAKLKF